MSVHWVLVKWLAEPVDDTIPLINKIDIFFHCGKVKIACGEGANCGDPIAKARTLTSGGMGRLGESAAESFSG